MKYLIKDENNETMRVVGRREEAKQIIASRAGWTMQCVRTPKPKFDFSKFEEALI